MQQLAFPSFSFRVKNSENTTRIFDIIRKKFVVLTPEEWVRQHVIHFLIETHHYPKSLLNVEKVIKVNNLTKRYDIVVFKPNGDLFLLVECKAPSVNITQQTFDQIAQYNLELNADFLMVTNGLQHYYCQIDYTAKKYHFIPEIPLYI